MSDNTVDQSDSGWRSSHAGGSDNNAETVGDQSTEKTGYPSDEELLRAFCGPNAEPFVRIHRAQESGKRKLSFNWVVLLAALPWFLYRKLYLYGIAIVLIPIVLVVVFPDLAGVSFAGAVGALAALSNSLYVQSATRRIGKLKALNLSPEELVERVKDAGGTSPVGAAFGAAVVASAIALPILSQSLAALPRCDDTQVRQFAEEIMTDGLSQQGMDTNGLSFAKFAAMEGSTEDTRRLCSFSMVLGEEALTMYLAITWRDVGTGEFEVTISPDPAALPE